MFGGVEWFLRTLARNGHYAPWMTTEFALCFDARIANDLRELGATVHLLGPVRVRDRRSVARARRRLLETLRAGAYDVVICHSAWPHAVFGPVVRQHGNTLVQFMHDLPNRRGWIDHLANRTPPDLVLCNTRFMQNAGPWWFAGVTRRMVRYPVPLVEVTDPDARSKMRASFQTSADSVVIVLASRMQAWKGHLVLVRALAELRHNPRWTCWITGGAQRAGESEYEQELKTEVERLGLAGRVKFLGYRSDVPAVMKAADIYCQPNVEPEPFGVSFLEALTAGLPIITTAMGGPLEIVDDRCGVLVPPGLQAVARALGALIDDDARRGAMSAAGPVRARELCDVPTRIRELGATLSSLTAPPASPARRRPPTLGLARLPRDPVVIAVAALVREQGDGVDIADLACRGGDLARRLEGRFRSYVGANLARDHAFPEEPGLSFRAANLNLPPYPFDDASATFAVSLRGVEQWENPRALFRELARIARPGGWVVVTSSNRLSLFSKVHLLARNRFPAAPGVPAPARVTSLVEGNLRRMAAECGLVDVAIRYTPPGAGWGATLGAPLGKWFGDRFVLTARRP